ncbi:hydrogenobyrinic acid a,c-diamide synthase (glutamine-hydrolysing) /cobyrinate a,c-diamide synthase [Dongia mobilis]|uniref:Cobyrinate a,c-diamide synthase n=1 Tax=Dongia mobilis TaxID=578943 RepID=A0A4R6WJ76_9PROT|nr:cobyrinate a,c-diamide synthase [Dongia mobilis]TDQ78504.1 hydrogenobyrinic acid a,c-diamide synthase (glutamine-hydrolysing) /cobyrinate a,c-diamide synthase [Dongia mobilis]
MAHGLIIAAPASGSGKTLTTLSLLSLLKARGIDVVGCKAGPDYIDPGFHAAATGKPCFNLDIWAMRREGLDGLLARQASRGDLVVVEGVMGLFDGIPGFSARENGSTAELARALGLPILLVMNVKGMGATAAALLQGIVTHDPSLQFAGVIFNQVGGPGHRDILARAAAEAGLTVFGCLPRVAELAVPERHLGLVQAREHAALDDFFAAARAAFGDALELEGIVAAAGEIAARPANSVLLPPLGQRIALAEDAAFAFSYPFHLEQWRAAGAEILPFAPLADQAPDASADAVFLPGGYPELHAGRLAGNRRFLDGLRAAAARGAVVYGECGGYMTLGSHLTDAAGVQHQMAGLLPVATSFATRRLHLGYRAAELLAAAPFGTPGTTLRGHEFHYATILHEGDAPALFRLTDARGRDLGPAGRRVGPVMGSFMHLIDRAA